MAALRFERFPGGGGAAYLDGSRDGPTLLWLGPGLEVMFGYNRPHAAMRHIANPERFGKRAPRTFAEFQSYAHAFHAGGLERGRGQARGKTTTIRYSDSDGSRHSFEIAEMTLVGYQQRSRRSMREAVEHYIEQDRLERGAGYDWEIAPGGLQAAAFPEQRPTPGKRPGAQLGLFRRMRSRSARRRGLR